MTTKEVKEYFKSLRTEQREINHLSQMIQREELTLLPKAITYDKDRVQTSPDDKLLASMAEMDEMRKELSRSITILKNKQAKAEAYIIRLDVPEEREVMRYYYLDTQGSRLLSWDDVGELMELGMRSVYRFHGNAISKLANIMQ